VSSATLRNGKEMDEKDLPDEKPDRVASARPQQGGFFSIYKKGQGYWTRMGTALGAALLLTVFAVFVYTELKSRLPNWIHTPQSVENLSAEELTKVNQANAVSMTQAQETANAISAGVTIGLVLLGALLVWRLMNKPSNADFLIATDVEMKKVNWTSRAELFGSTRIVIIFVFLIAAILFLVDVGTGMFFQLIGLLKFGPLS
jgi:preprotein translocase subunit SecE